MPTGQIPGNRSHWGQRSQQKGHHWNRPQGWERACQRCPGWACRDSTNAALPSGGHHLPTGGALERVQPGTGLPHMPLAVSTAFCPPSHTRTCTHAPTTKPSVGDEGRPTGLQRRPAFLYVLQKCQVFPLQLLLNIGLKTLVGSSERLGLSTGCRSSSALRISDSLMKQLLGQKSTICKM